MITPKRPAGFNEFLPADQLAFNALIAIIRMSYEQHGFTPIETPALELASVLHAKEGGESAKQGYRFTKGDSDLALRFDLTVPLARYVAEHYHELAFPFRRYQIQDVWRAEKPQAGRYRQFCQCDIDIIGSTSVAADADVLITMSRTYKALGLSTAVLHISNRKIISGILEARKLSKHSTEIMRQMDKLDKIGVAGLRKNLAERGLKESDISLLASLAAIAGTISEVTREMEKLDVSHPKLAEGLDELAATASLLDAAGLKKHDYTFNLGMMRGFDYYTGVVFEAMLSDKPEAGAVGSGGRYDNLVGYYRSEPLAGVGASIGLSRLFSAIHGELADGPSSPSQALVVVFNEKLLPFCFSVAQKLQSAGLNVEVYPSADKAGKQLGYADKTGIPFALLCGEDEEKKKSVTIKDMQTGDQKTLKLTEAARYLKKQL